MKNDVTIIVPIYNVEKYIEKCLNSLVNQTYKSIEIFAINDGSLDNSKEIVKEFLKKDERIRYFEKENGGYGSALELAINKITTEYFLICDPDDWLEKDAIEKLYSTAKKEDADIVLGNFNYVYENGEIKNTELCNEFYDIKANKVYTKEIEKFAFFQPSPHSKLFRTKICKNIKFPHKVSYTDFVLYSIALKNAKRVIRINEQLSYYFLDRPGNTRTDKKPKAVKDHIVVWNSIYSQIDTNKDTYLIFRLYKELKYITKVYYKNSNNLFKDSLFLEIKELINKLRPFYKKIKKQFTKKIINKIEIIMIFHSTKSLKLFISLRKIINK